MQIKDILNAPEFFISTRAKAQINSYFDGMEEFLDATAAYFANNKSRESAWVHKLSVKPNSLSNLVSEIQRWQSLVIPSRTILQFDKAIDYDESVASGKIITDTGKSPKYLFRVVSPEELAQAKIDGYLRPSAFYKRIHASVQPEAAYGGRGHTTLAIAYDSRDKWEPKMASTGVYATTKENIDLDKVFVAK